MKKFSWQGNEDTSANCGLVVNKAFVTAAFALAEKSPVLYDQDNKWLPSA